MRRKRIRLWVIFLLTTLGALAMLNRAKERPLTNTLFAFRCVLDEYTYDEGECPRSVQDLVREGYLRRAPADPNHLFDRLVETCRNEQFSQEPVER